MAASFHNRDAVQSMQKIRLSKSCLGDEERDAAARVIAAGYLGMGEETRAFEEELQAAIGGGREVICVNTGTSALHLAMACRDIAAGDEVLVPTVTYVACFQAVSALGAVPIACDVIPETALIDLDDAARRLTRRTRAIMPVHYASNSDGISKVYTFATNHGIHVIEDAAHAFGGTRDGRPVGSEGDAICFSFDGIKNITCGEGGAVITGDAQFAQRLRDGRLLGVEKDTDARYRSARSWDFDVQHQGFRYHLSNLNAAIGRAQLRKFPRFAEKRRTLAKRYVERLRNRPHLTLLDIDYEHAVPHIFPLRVRDGRRDGVRSAFAENNIEWGFHYKPNHLLTLYRHGGNGHPVGDMFDAELLTLPLHPDLTEQMQDAVIDTLEQVIAEH
jgi:dTDP-4-amino-4,6-dideoxygalactose transaminase